MQKDSAVVATEITETQRWMAAEVNRAEALLPQYAPAVIVRPENETQEAHTRAMFQTIARVVSLQIEMTKLLTTYFELPADASAVGTVHEFTQMVAVRKAIRTANPEQTVTEIEGRLGVDLTKARETLSVLPEATEFANQLEAMFA